MDISLNNSPALGMQVGGEHYVDMEMQPIVLFAALRWDYFRASICGYVSRYKQKNGAEDLRKAAHTFLLAEELDVPSGCGDRDVELVNIYCTRNNLSSEVTSIIKAAMYGDWLVGHDLTAILLGSEYPDE